jgi:hypothetical protein
VNRRAIGCAVIGVAAFLAIGLFGLSRAVAPTGCPDRLQYLAEAYLPEGAPIERPDPSLVEIGSTFIGLTTRTVYAEPGVAPATGSTDPPDRFVLDCADGTFQAYVLGAPSPS